MSINQLDSDLQFDDPKEIFESAIKVGFFKDEEDAALFMYMWSKNQEHVFKNIKTRKYVSFKRALQNG